LRREQYAVALALLENGIVRIGVLGCPDLTVQGEQEVGGPGSLAVAVRGEGAWAAPLDVPELTADQFVELRVSGRRTLHQARMLRSVEAVHTHGGKIEELAEQLGIEAEPVRMDSQAKYAVLASGGADLLVRLLSPSRPDYRETIWDHAAGSLIVEQAGGRVTDLDGKPLDFTAGRRLIRNRGLVASNKHLHDAILAGLASVGA
jgi:3'(2'), 5'-bisphosphate nucleotidase